MVPLGLIPFCALIFSHRNMYLDLYILESILRPVRLPAWFLLGGALDLAQDLGAVLGSPKYNIM